MIIISLVLSAAIIAMALLGVGLYSYRKTKALRLLGYEFLYYFMKNCDSLDYYRNKDKHISIFEDNKTLLASEADKWYVFKRNSLVISQLIDIYESADELTTTVHPYFLLNHYFAYSEYQKFAPLASKLDKVMKLLVNREFETYVEDTYNETNTISLFQKSNLAHWLATLRTQHNNEFVEKELKEQSQFFDTVLKYPLDPQQRESIVRLEDNCLVISSAGSGKTSTSIAKVKYLLEKRHLKKEEILVMSYNSKTSEEFQERLDVSGLTCKTFHALAMSIIGQVENKRPDVCDDRFILTCYYNLVKNIREYKGAINKFVSEVSSITKTSHEYGKAKDYFKDRETYGIMAPYGDMNGAPVFTRSEEEKKICTWLSTHDVQFLYEEPYPFNTADSGHRQYKPDFTIYFSVGGKHYYVFLEHFGIDRNGNVPKWFGDGHPEGFYRTNVKYNSDILWKRQIHQKNNTLLLETTSAMFHDGTVFTNLEHQLRKIGVPTRELSEEEKYNMLIERNKAMEDSIMNLIASFINLMKSNGKNFEIIMNDIIKSGQDAAFIERCRYLMYEVIKPLYDEYEKQLKAKGQMDFTDLVLHASELCNSGKWQTPYSYILVDEFQDISIDRYKFILSLRKQNPLTKTYCVGDDWQSIYRFSGSDMNLFNNFEKYFGFTEKCKIETTYRFGNPLVERSSAFILKNPSQVQKAVKPYSQKVTTEISFVPFIRVDKESYLGKIREVLDGIPANETVMLMARYNYEVTVFPSECVKQTPNSKRAKVRFAGREMDFMSVHAAKGLEADNVLILNCSQDSGGFPSRITDDPILGFVLSEIDTFEYSEERRLFYVAITRAKKHTFVLYNSNMPSVFVTEMLDGEDKEQMLCPRCKKGRFKMIKDAVSVNGKPYRNYVCSNSVAGCSFFWQVYYKDEADIINQYHRQMDQYFKRK